MDQHPNTLQWNQWGQPLLRDVVDTIEYAASDPTVHGIVAHVGEESNFGMAQIQEIRDSIRTFSAATLPDTVKMDGEDEGPAPKKKFSLAIADTFGLLGGALSPYYLATAFDQIMIQPGGYVAISGLRAEPVFIKGLFDKIGVTPRFLKRADYKVAPNTFTETGLTPPHRESIQSILDDISAQIVAGIAACRRLSEENVRKLVSSSPHPAPEAQRLGLVDNFGFPYFVYMMKEKSLIPGLRKLIPQLPDNARVVKFDDYMKDFKKQKLKEMRRPKQAKVALIYATGEVVGGRSRQFPGALNAMQVNKQIVEATVDPNVKAIVLRINSPGGSAIASEMVYHAVMEARQCGKLVVASMGDVAASGGYYVAMGADKIVAQPGTITGSIGVFFGKFVIDRLLEKKLGIKIDGIYPDTSSRWMSPVLDWNKTDQQQLNVFLDATYEDFIERASKGRNLPIEHIAQVAKGRVWTGQQAKNAKLIDELGGLNRAIELAKQLAMERDDQIKTFKVVLFPERHNFLQKLFNLVENSDSVAEELTESVGAIRLLASTITKVGHVVNPLLKIVNRPQKEQTLLMSDEWWESDDTEHK